MPEITYTIGFDYLSPIKIYKIKGFNGSTFTFDHGMVSSGKLKDSSNSTLIEFYNSNPLSNYYSLSLSGFQTSLNSVRFENHIFTGYTISGNSGSRPFNWEWKSENMGYKQTLVGNTNRGQILAQITDNVLSLSKEGTVIVANCVPSDYHKVIVATSAFIWMKKHNRK